MCSLQHSVSFTGKFWLNFDLKNMISTYTKEKNDPNLPDFEDCFFWIARFLWSVPAGRQKYRRIRFVFLLSYLVGNQIWLNYSVNDLPLWLHHKILKRNPAPATLQETHPKPNSGRLDVEKLISLLTIDPSPLCTLTWHSMHHDDHHPSDVHHDECGWICSTDYECTNSQHIQVKMWHMTQNGLKCSHMEQ
jgi:hypothetical protein